MEQGNELRLPEFEIFNIEERDGIRYYSVTPKDKVYTCPDCGSKHVVKNGSFVRLARDLPSYGEPVAILVNASRLLCMDCGRSITPSFDSIEDRDKITKRLRDYIRERCLTTRIMDVATETGVSSATVERIATEYIREKESDWQFYVPEVLGLVNIKVGKKIRVLCVDVKRSGVVDILEESTKETIRRYLLPATKDHKERVFVIDMNDNYRDLIIEMFPESMIVIDEFFVAGKIIKAINSDLGRLGNNKLRTAILKNFKEVSSEEEELLDKYVMSDKRLYALHTIKEDLFSIYSFKAETSGQETVHARSIIKDAIRTVPSDALNTKALLKRMQEYEEEILEYLVLRRESKSYIPTAIGMANEIERIGAGYSFRNLRARLLFGGKKKTAQTTIKKPVYKKPSGVSDMFKVVTPGSWRGEIVGYTEEIVTLGDYVSLTDMLESL